MKLILLITALVLLPATAHAGPIAGAIATITSTWFGSFLFKTALSLGLSLLSQVLFRPDQQTPDRGVNIRQTGSGGDMGQRFIMGRYATGGQLLAPPFTGPSGSGQHPNRRLHYVVGISCIPGVTFRRWWIDGQEPTANDFTEPDGSGEQYAFRGSNTGVSLLWRDDESEPPPYLLGLPLEKRPWQSDMVGTGITYAMARFGFNEDAYRGKPSVRFEVDGIPLLDPRDGVVRQTDNPVIMIWNVLRGIEIPGGEGDPDVWGYGVAADDLPDSVWFAAMNECDVQVDDGEGGTVPQYRAGIEVDVVEDEPAEVIDRLLSACAGQIVEMGGRWRIRVGGPGAPVLFISDEDIVITASSDFEPFPGLQSTNNALHASYPEPDAAWEPKDAPPRYNADYEADDDGRRLVASVEMPAVWDKSQVQRLMISYIEEERRFRRHQITLPPSGAVLEPLDSIAWTSERNFYDEKVFEVSAIEDNLATLAQGVALRERDPDDYDPPQDYFVPTPITPPEPEPIPVQGVPGWGVQAVAIKDGEDNERRPDIKLTWFGFDPNDDEGGPGDDIRALNWEVRLAGGDLVAKGSTEDIPAGELLVGSSALVADTTYEARGRYRAPGRPTEWTDWTPVTTTDTRIGEGDFRDDLRHRLDDGEATANQAAEDAQQALSDAADALSKAQDVEGDFSGFVDIVEAEYNGLQAFVDQTIVTAVDLDGFQAAFAGITVDTTDGSIAGFRATSFSDPDGSSGSALELLGDQVVVPGSLSSASVVVSDGSGNLIPERYYRTGDVPGVVFEDNWSIVEAASDGSNAGDGAPSRFILKNSGGTGSEQVTVLGNVTVEQGESFAGSFLWAHNGSSTEEITFGLRFRWLDKDGNSIGFDPAWLRRVNESRNGSNWTKFTFDPVETPASAESLEILLSRANDTLSNNAGYLTDIRVYRQVSAAIQITPESITGAQLIKTQALITAQAQMGSAVIGTAQIDEIQSSNFIAGQQGYRIDQSGAEFGTLEIRNEAVTSQVYVHVGSAQTVSSSSDVVSPVLFAEVGSGLNIIYTVSLDVSVPGASSLEAADGYVDFEESVDGGSTWDVRRRRSITTLLLGSSLHAVACMTSRSPASSGTNRYRARFVKTGSGSNFEISRLFFGVQQWKR